MSRRQLPLEPEAQRRAGRAQPVDAIIGQLLADRGTQPPDEAAVDVDLDRAGRPPELAHGVTRRPGAMCRTGAGPARRRGRRPRWNRTRRPAGRVADVVEIVETFDVVDVAETFEVVDRVLWAELVDRRGVDHVADLGGDVPGGTCSTPSRQADRRDRVEAGSASTASASSGTTPSTVSPVDSSTSATPYGPDPTSTRKTGASCSSSSMRCNNTTISSARGRTTNTAIELASTSGRAGEPGRAATHVDQDVVVDERGAAVLMWTAEARRAAAVRSLEGWATTTGTPDCNGWA